MQSKAIFKFVDGSGIIIQTVDVQIVKGLVGYESLHEGLKLTIDSIDFEIESFEVEVFNQHWPHTNDLEEIDRGIQGEYNTNILVYINRI